MTCLELSNTNIMGNPTFADIVTYINMKGTEIELQPAPYPTIGEYFGSLFHTLVLNNYSFVTNNLVTTPTNAKPYIEPILNTFTDINTELIIPFVAIDYAGGTLALNVSVDEGVISTTLSQVTFTPTLDYEGPCNVILTANDGIDSFQRTFSIEVTADGAFVPEENLDNQELTYEYPPYNINDINSQESLPYNSEDLLYDSGWLNFTGWDNEHTYIIDATVIANSFKIYLEQCVINLTQQYCIYTEPLSDTQTQNIIINSNLDDRVTSIINQINTLELGPITEDMETLCNILKSEIALVVFTITESRSDSSNSAEDCNINYDINLISI